MLLLLALPAAAKDYSSKIKDGRAGYELGCYYARSTGLQVCGELKAFKVIDASKISDQLRREFHEDVLAEQAARLEDQGTLKKCPESRPLCPANFSGEQLDVMERATR